MSLRSTAVSVVRALRLEPVLRPAYQTVRALPQSRRRFGRHLRWLANVPARRRLSSAWRDILAKRIEFETTSGSPDAAALAVVMCLWNRPERIDAVLAQLDAQQTTRPLRLVLWNNQPSDDDHYRDAIARFEASGALSSIELHTSAHNIGGIGRFVAIRELRRRGYSGEFIMLDDDEDVTPQFASTLQAAAAPHTIGSIWAFLMDDISYWNRLPLAHTGEIAQHTGTGGCVCDSSLVDHDEFFTRIPLEFLFIEDLWMSRVARANGWNLIKVDSPVEFVLAERDQGHAIQENKNDFFLWLARPGSVPVWT